MSEEEYVGTLVFDYGTAIPSIDMGQPIVRCRDCRYGNEVTWPTWSNIPQDYLDCTGELVETWDYYNDQPSMNPVKPDGYCAWACRKEGE